MKKFLSLMLAFMFCLSFGCSKQTERDYVFTCPDGAPALAVAKLISEKDSLGLNGQVNYNVVTATAIKTEMTEGKSDMLLMPINLASKFYKANADDSYVLVAVVTHGNFYIMSTTKLTVNDLNGKQVAVPNMNAVPDWTFQSALTKHGLSIGEQGVKIQYYQDGSKIVQMMNSGAESIGLVPEPAATNLEKAFGAKNKEIYRMDLQELYDQQNKAYPQAVLMVKKSVITENLYNELKTAIGESVAWTKENISTAVSAIGEKFATTLDATKLSADSIDRCKIYFEGYDSAKQSVNAYINDIRAISENSANIVGEDFFYSK